MYETATDQVKFYTRDDLKFIEPLLNNQTLHIVDSRDPIDWSPCTIVLVCSPRLEHESEISKKNTQRFYMPRWKLDELEACRKAFYDDLPARRFSQGLVQEMEWRATICVADGSKQLE